MTYSVMPAMVQSFEIGERCLDTYPCSHSCKITLYDKREKSLLLNGDRVYALIEEIAANKILGNKDHFAQYENYPELQMCMNKIHYIPPIPEHILSHIFK